MVAARDTSHPLIAVDCPVCGLPLPPVGVDVDVRSDVDPGRPRRGRVLRLTVTAQDLDAAWWDAARAGHPDCVPATLTVEPGLL